MLRFAANLSFLFQDLPFPERYAAAARAGFTGVECLFPDGQAAKDLAAVRAAAGIRQALINTPTGDATRGERGLACLPGREADFRDAVATAIEYATALDCPRIHIVAGVAPADVARDRLERTYRDNLAWAADALAGHGLTAMIEPINQRDIPGFFLRDGDHAAAVIEDLGAANIRLQYDLYHAQITEGDLARNIERFLPLIGHIQIANPPDRSEPDQGEINYPYLFDLLERLGYQGWIACEYRPRRDTLSGLGWGAAYGLGAAAPVRS